MSAIWVDVSRQIIIYKFIYGLWAREAKMIANLSIYLAYFFLCFISFINFFQLKNLGIILLEQVLERLIQSNVSFNQSLEDTTSRYMKTPLLF